MTTKREAVANARHFWYSQKPAGCCGAGTHSRDIGCPRLCALNPVGGPTVCLRGTRSLKTEQDEEADRVRPWAATDRWTPVRLAHPRVRLVQMMYPVRDPPLLKPAALGPSAEDHRQLECLSLQLLSFRALLSLSRGFGLEHQVFMESLILAQDERWRRA